MGSFLTRHKNVLVLAAVLLVQVIGLATQIRRTGAQSMTDGRNVRLIRYWAVSAVAPLEDLLLTVTGCTRFAWSNYIDLRHVRRDNQALRAEVSRLRLEQASVAEDAKQAHRLQALLGFSEHYISKTLAAQVTGTSGTEQSRMFYIDKGARDGLHPDMPVITPDGIVGKLKDVFPSTAQVLEVSDQTSGAGVVLASTRIRGILRGTAAGELQIINLLPDDRIKAGERVLTSGGDQVFPKGLPVGEVVSVQKDRERDPYITVSVRPAARLSQLEEVLVITQFSSRMTDAEQADFREADAMAAGSGTSYLLSEKLPGKQALGDAASPDLLHSANGDQLADPESHASIVPPPPKPFTALQADRFSPPKAKPPTAPNRAKTANEPAASGAAPQP